MSGGRLAGHVAVVTGASRGIGAAIARSFAAEGAKVVCTGRSEDALRKLAADIEHDSGVAAVVPCDVTDDDQVTALADRADEAFGSVDILVNNAGVHEPGSFLDYGLDDWRRMVDVNLLGTVRVTRAFLPAMLAAGNGRIVNIASTAGKYGSLFQSPYNATKHAVVGLTRCLALETATSGVRVNAICPGFVDTGLINNAAPEFGRLLGIPHEQVLPALLERVPIGRLISPDEVAELALYLTSPAGDAMTGQALTVAGGLILV